MIHLLDTGPLVAALAREEPRFGSWAKDVLRHLPHPLYTCESVLTEAAHSFGDPGPILAAVADGLLVCPWDLCEHNARIRELVRKYAESADGSCRRLLSCHEREMVELQGRHCRRH